MSMHRFVLRPRAGVWVLAAALLACGGSNGSGGAAPSEDGGGSDATSGDATTPSDSGSGGPDAAFDSSPQTDAMHDGGSLVDGTVDTDSGLTEPGYLRNDALAGFAYTADFGSPYDSILASPINTTQSALGSYTKTPAAGQIVTTTNYWLVANSSDVYHALAVSASLSVSTGLASVSAKASWAQSQKVDTTDLSVLVDLVQVGQQQKIVNPALTPQAAALTPEQFYALYGDRYAADIVTGAEMYCMLTIHTYSEEDKSSLTTQLNFSYGASTNASATFQTDASSVLTNHQTQASCQYLGYTPTSLVTDLPSLLSAANAFQTSQGGGNTQTSTLYLLYTSYYGIPGYPGVPAGTDVKVTQQAQAASDFLLYDSLVNQDFAPYYADTNYSGKSFFIDMKAYDTALSQYMSAALANSQNPGVAVPTPQADALISNWKSIPGPASASGATPSFQTYGTANGIVPKKLADYDIPLKYAYPDGAGNGTLNGTLFKPVQPIPAVPLSSTTTPVTYSLYLVNPAINGGNTCLEYRWDTGTYFFTNVTDSNGLPVASQVNAAISSFGLAGNISTQYVIANKANGLVMTDMGVNSGMVATHFAPSNASQYWYFYLDDGAGNCSTYVPNPMPVGVGCTVGGNYPGTNCGSGIYAISAQNINSTHASGYWNISSTNPGSPIDANGPGGCQHCNNSCSNANWCAYTSNGGGPSPWDLFFLEATDSGTTHAIYNYAGTGGGAVSWVATDPNVTAVNTPPPGYGNPLDGGVLEEAVETAAYNGQSNQLWVFIPSTSIDTSP